jgi:hypothetical protein
MVPDAVRVKYLDVGEVLSAGPAEVPVWRSIIQQTEDLQTSISNEVLCNFSDRFALDYLASWRAAPLAK